MIDVHDQTCSFASVTQAQSHGQSFKGRIKKIYAVLPGSRRSTLFGSVYLFGYVWREGIENPQLSHFALKCVLYK